MPPDLNSLPSSAATSSNPSQRRPTASTMANAPPTNSPSPRPSIHSLAAAATMNATERRSSQGTGSPQLGRRSSERRRSQVLLNLSLNDPTIPAPGELSSTDRRVSFGTSFSSMSPANLGGRSTIATGDPHHHRQPSLGDIHNELEQEQEAQVNRMLALIRAQQQQLETLRAQQAGPAAQPGNSPAVDDTTPQSERSFSFPSVHPAVGSIPRPTGRLSRENSNSNRSPTLRPLPSQEFSTDAWPPSPVGRRSSSSRRESLRDENAYYQAEYSSLQRENQMLRMRIRELEKQVQERQHSPANTPAQPSNLVTSPPLEPEDAKL